MSRACPSCGARAARTRFCTSCGRPLPSGRRNPWSTVLLAAVAVVVVAVAGVVLLQTAGSADSEPAGVATLPASSPAASVAPDPSGLSRATGAPSTAQPARSAAAQLSAIESADAAAVGRLQGYWVPQVSAKREGLVADGRVYDQAAILAEHQRLARAYPGVVLFESDRFASYRSSGFWISAVAVPYTTAAEANAWCDAGDLTADACFAKRLVQSPGGRNTVPR